MLAIRAGRLQRSSRVSKAIISRICVGVWRCGGRDEYPLDRGDTIGEAVQVQVQVRQQLRRRGQGRVEE